MKNIDKVFNFLMVINAPILIGMVWFDALLLSKLLITNIIIILGVAFIRQVK